MVSKRSRLIALVLAVMTLLSVVAVGTFSTSAASGDTVFCENAAGWSDVYCYMWGDGTGENQGWPGVKMTKGEGNLWSYTLTGDWNGVVFNSGSDQNKTGDLTFPGNGGCYNNSTGSWSTLEVPDNPQLPTTPVTPDTPVAGGKVYIKDTAGWGNIHVYMWNSENDKNATWPGVKATSIGDGVYEYAVTKSFKNIIFNNGSDASKTADLTYPGEGMIYDNGTGSWDMYDTSKLHIKSFTADVESPQYTGVKINLTAVAGGEGAFQYKFSVGTDVISDFSSKSTVSWTPAKAGNYTVKLEVKDSKGDLVSKTLTFEIKDISTETSPVIQNVEATPTNFANNEILKGKEAKINVTAGGGNTGTKLLFYKMTVTDSNGETVNVPYYSLKNETKFTPAQEGKYSFTASVQASDNSFTARTVEYKAVGAFSEPGDLTASVSAKDAGDNKYTIKAEGFGGTAPYTYKFEVNGETKQDFGTADTYTLTATPGTYTVKITVKDSKGKTATDETVVQVADPTVQPTVPTTPVNPDASTPGATTPDATPGTTVPGTTVPGTTDAPETQALALTVDATDIGNGNYKFTANATGGTAPYQYKFVANTYTLADYTSANTFNLDMSADGVYTVQLSVKDAAGAVVTKELVITVQNGEAEIPTEPSVPVEALDFDVDYTKNGSKVTITVDAAGGTGVYEYSFTIFGTEYPSETNSFTCDMSVDYVYDVVVTVKDSAGTVLSKTVSIEIKNGEIVKPSEPGITTEPSETPGGTTTVPTPPAGAYLKGDADENGKVNIKDATTVQKHVAKLLTLSKQGVDNADVDGNGNLNVKDATTIQKFIANLIDKW